MKKKVNVSDQAIIIRTSSCSHRRLHKCNAMGVGTTSWADLVEENDGVKIMELVGLFLGLLATCFCWQLCSIASTSNADGLQQPLHPNRADVQTIEPATMDADNTDTVDASASNANHHVIQ